ncbi:unnamed protein product, partial [Prorocentrum cordatum]
CARRAGAPLGLPVLSAASVRTKARRRAYAGMLDGVGGWVKPLGRSATTSTTFVDMGASVRDGLARLFQLGRRQTCGNRILAAVARRGPRHAEAGPRDLPSAQQAAKGRRQLAPPKIQMATPIEAVAMIINYTGKCGLEQQAIAARLLFEIHGRPGEIHGPRIKVGEASKTGEFDAAARLDLERQLELGPARPQMNASRRRDGAAETASLFTISQSEAAAARRDAAQAPGLKKLGARHLRQLRHSGPSHDYAANLRGLEHIRRRGRWKSRRSARRRGIGGHLTQQLQEMGAAHTPAPAASGAPRKRPKAWPTGASGSEPGPPPLGTMSARTLVSEPNMPTCCALRRHSATATCSASAVS